MKKSSLILITVFAAGALMLTMAFSPADKTNNQQWIPYFMERLDLESSVSYQDTPREMKEPGKIYVRGNYIFVNEKYKGVHVIDNTNPENPIQKAFIVVPGCLDMAVKDNVMYVDNAVDLVAFDMDTKTVTKRLTDYFPERPSPDGLVAGYWDRPKDYVLVGWKENPNYNKK